jgi:FkbM family methyltransferase
MKSLMEILKSNGIPFNGDKIKIDPSFKHIKLDIGLSYNAPQTQNWLQNESDLLVFGFEPNPSSVESIKSPENHKTHPSHGEVLEQKYIGTSAFIIPIALGSQNSSLNFYVTQDDPGTSSLYEPKTFAIKEIIEVPVFQLSAFFDLLPFETINFIEYIKIDAQGSDLQIVQSGKDYIQEKVVYITVEAESEQYLGSDYNNETNISEYMNSIGFKKIYHPNTTDPTYVNLRFIEESKHIYINQIN